MTCSITATASIVSTLLGMKTRSWAWSSMLSYLTAFAGYDWCWLVFELSVCDGLKLLCFRYLWTRVVITMWTLMYEILVNYLWNVCNMWLVMLNHYGLGCMQVGLKSFAVSVDYWVYMGSSMIVRLLRWLLLYLCSYKLDGSVTMCPILFQSFCIALLSLFRNMLERLYFRAWSIYFGGDGKYVVAYS